MDKIGWSMMMMMNLRLFDFCIKISKIADLLNFHGAFCYFFIWKVGRNRVNPPRFDTNLIYESILYCINVVVIYKSWCRPFLLRKRRIRMYQKAIRNASASGSNRMTKTQKWNENTYRRKREKIQIVKKTQIIQNDVMRIWFRYYKITRAQ